MSSILLGAWWSRPTFEFRGAIQVSRGYDGPEIDEGCLFTRGVVGRKVWVARWREDVLRPDGTIGRTMRSQVIGPVCRIPTRREARNLLTSLLRPTNLGLRKAHSTMLFRDFAQTWEEAVLPTYRASPRNFYRDILRRHLAPKFAQYRLCDICTPDLQIFLNKKG